MTIATYFQSSRVYQIVYTCIYSNPLGATLVTHLYVEILVTQMLGNELDRLGSFAGLRGEQYGIGGFTFAATTIAKAQLGTTVHLAIDLAVGMMQIRQFHDLHFGLLAANCADMFGQLGGGAIGGMGMRRHAHSGHFHHPTETCLAGTLHEQKGGQVMQENGPDPHGHAMCARTTEIPIDNDDCDQNGNRVHDEGEQQILGDQRQHQRCGWQNLRHKQQEHNQ